jgi:hypothetical protein
MFPGIGSLVQRGNLVRICCGHLLVRKHCRTSILGKRPYLQLYRWYLPIAKRKDSSQYITRVSVLSLAADIGATRVVDLALALPFGCDLSCPVMSFPALPLSRQLAPTFSKIKTSFGASFSLRIPPSFTTYY